MITDGGEIYRIDCCDFPRVTEPDSRSHSRCVRRNFELHSPVDSTLVFSVRRNCIAFAIEYRLGVWEAERAAWGVLEDEEKEDYYRGGEEFNGGSSRRFTFVFHIGAWMRRRKSNPRRKSSELYKAPDGNLVTYKHESVKRGSRKKRQCRVNS